MSIVGALLWLSLNVYYEARSEEPINQIAIAHVTINRSKNMNLTVKEVVLQPKQFSWTRDKQKRKGIIPKDKEAFEECVASAVTALSSPDITGGATHFHEKRVNPSWARAKSMRFLKSYGKHKFYKKGTPIANAKNKGGKLTAKGLKSANIKRRV